MRIEAVTGTGYNPDVAKPKSSNRSIRLADEMWAWLNAEADRRQNSVNGIVSEFLMVARLRAEERAADASGKAGDLDPPSVSRRGAATRKPAVSQPSAQTSASEEWYDRTQPKGPSRLSLNLQVGPVARKPGEMLKGKKP